MKLSQPVLRETHQLLSSAPGYSKGLVVYCDVGMASRHDIVCSHISSSRAPHPHSIIDPLPILVLWPSFNTNSQLVYSIEQQT